MRKTGLALAIAVWSTMCLAAAPSDELSTIVFSTPEGRPVSTALRMKADYVAAPVTISSEQGDPDRRFEEVRQAKDRIISQAKEKPGLRVHTGPIALSASPRPGFGVLPPEAYSALYYAEPSEASLYLLAPLEEGQDSYAAAAKINQLLNEVRLPGRCRWKCGHMQLAAENPEQYRPKILQMISGEMRATKDALAAAGKTTLEGLESPVKVFQADDTHVDLFINYRLSVAMGE
ncbi:MAG: hypothetical protein NTW86_23670 [Candidatus Sumerlaeota bacterium]|nr:hypothetical protein [Candidatus Sumerlaeota bacterium]